MPYSKLYILTELSVNDVKFISVDRQKLDISKYIYLWYRKIFVEIQPDYTNIKIDPRIQCTKRIELRVGANRLQKTYPR